MVWLKNLLGKFGPHEEMHVWDSRVPIINLTQAEDRLTVGDLQGSGGLSIMGASGSGKTSIAAPYIAYPLMKLGCGFCWPCVKPDEVHLAMRIAESAGRAKDVVIIGEDAEGNISPARFNLLDHESQVATNGTGTLVTALSDCEKMLARKEGERNASEDERFWQSQFERQLRYVTDTARLAKRPLTVDLLRKIQLSAPKNKDQLADADFQRDSECFKCLRDAEMLLSLGQIAEADFQRILNYWLNDYVNFDVKPRSTIDVMFACLCDAFLAEEPLRTILTTTTTVSPDDVLDGKVVILNLPINVYGAAGRMAQHAFKASLQRAILRRKKPADGSRLRPCVIWLDEAHALTHFADASFFAECRSNGCINVYIDQGIGGYMRALGLSHPDEVDGFLQNLSVKIFFMNQSPNTNQFAADAAGKIIANKHTATFNASQHGSNVGESVTPEEKHQLISGLFGQLKRGGAENDGLVEAVVLKPGLFRATGSNVALCTFRQTNLTR